MIPVVLGHGESRSRVVVDNGVNIHQCEHSKKGKSGEQTFLRNQVRALNVLCTCVLSLTSLAASTPQYFRLCLPLTRRPLPQAASTASISPQPSDPRNRQQRRLPERILQHAPPAAP